MTTLTLPWPPAVNNLFATFNNRRIPSRRYKAWLAEAACALGDQQLAPVRGSFHVRILCDRPDRRKRDLDGLMKAPLDLMVKAGLIEDDSLAQSLTIAWSDAEPKKPGAVRICVEGI